MKIFIPSLARAHLTRTFGYLPTRWQRKAVYVVPSGSVGLYRARGYPVVGCPAKGIGPTRQWVIDNNTQPVLMLDDDLWFYNRTIEDPSKFLKATPNDVGLMLDRVEGLTKMYAHGGIAIRGNANTEHRPLIECTRNLRALWYDPRVLKKHGVRFDRVPVMEDFDVALQLLRLGYPSAKLNSWVQDQPGSNTEGGCSTYRTPELQAKAARTLAKLHPDFVTVVEKSPLASGGWNGQPRIDVKIAWKRAYESARSSVRRPG